jgi:hypothetical protein
MTILAELATLPELAGGGAWLTEARATVHADPAALATLFPAAGRHCGRAPLAHPPGWTQDDAARVLLLAAVPADAVPAQLESLYRYGDAAERRAVLRALDVVDLPGAGDAGLPLVHDALRTNDTRLVAAALGPYAAARLDADAWRQAVLKCVFVGIPLEAVSGLTERADAALAGMLAGFVRERVAAGRAVPADVWPVVGTDPATVSALREALRTERQSEVAARAAAADQALSAVEEFC